VNNAEVMPLSPLERAKTDEWDRMIDVNLRGVLHGIAAALPFMKQQRAGHIINTGSVAAYKLFPAAAVYCATKFAVRALTEGLRQEAKPYDQHERQVAALLQVGRIVSVKADKNELGLLRHRTLVRLSPEPDT
jgi:NADP-dependent 3-hydroxy acid dehydrogenase YdfG